MPRVTVTHGPDRTASAEVDTTTTVVQRRSTDARVLGSLLVTFGIGWFLRQVGVDLSWEAIIAGVLLALGLNMMITPRAGSGTKLWFLGVGLTLALASISSVSTAFPGGGVDDRYLTPISRSELLTHYEQAAGEFTLDLTQVADELPPGETAVEVELGAGRISVIVPADVGVRVESKFTAGQLQIFGQEIADGVLKEKVWVSPDYATQERKVVLRLETSFGQILVGRAGEPLVAGTNGERGNGFDFNFEFDGRGSR